MRGSSDDRTAEKPELAVARHLPLKPRDLMVIKQAVVGAFDWGARTACIMAALWPDRVRGLVSVSGYLIGSPKANTAPTAR